MSFSQQLPEWDNAGLDPGQTKKTSGWILGDKPPYQWMNWLFNRIYNCILEMRQTFNQQGYCVDSGAANNYVVTVDTLPATATSIPIGLNFRFKAANANTGPSTIIINGYTPAINLAKQGGAALSAGDIQSGSIIHCAYDGTNVQIIPSVPSSLPASGGNSTTVNNHTANATPSTTEQTDLIKMTNEVLGDVNTHLADEVRHEQYSVATGSANTYAVTLSPVPTACIDGMNVSVKINTTNTGASTINVNGLGAKPIKDSLGAAINPGTLLANNIYWLVYETTYGGFILANSIQTSSIAITNAPTTAGTSTAYTLALNQFPAAYATGVTVTLIANANCGASPTLNINGLGAKNLIKRDGTAYNANDLVANNPYSFTYNGISFVEDSPKDYTLDFVSTDHYALAINSGNAYSVTLSPVPAAYTDGMTVKVKFNAASTAAISLNVNGLGAKNVVDYFGNAVTNVRANLIATLCYEANSGNFILQGKGGGGNTIASHVLVSDTCTTDTGPITGTMPNNGSLNYTPSASVQNIPVGYISGGSVAAVSVPVANVLIGTTIAGQTGAMPENGAVVITPSTSNQTIANGHHNGSGYVKGEPNLIASNLVAGNTYFGITGSATIESLGGKKGAYGNGTSDTSGHISVSGLTFTPNFVIVEIINTQGYVCMYSASPDSIQFNMKHMALSTNTSYQPTAMTTDLAISGGSFTCQFPNVSSAISYYWQAFE